MNEWSSRPMLSAKGTPSLPYLPPTQSPPKVTQKEFDPSPCWPLGPGVSEGFSGWNTQLHPPRPVPVPPSSPFVPSGTLPRLTIQLVVDHLLQVVQALQDGFAVHQRAHLGVPAPHPAVGAAHDLHQPL